VTQWVPADLAERPTGGARDGRRTIGYPPAVRTLLLAFLFLASALPAWAQPSLAIADLVNNTGDARYDPAGPGVAALLVSRFVKTDAVRIVERTQLQAVIAEMKLSETGLVDDATAIRAGRLVGAQYMALGSIFSVQLPVLSVSLRVVNTETGDVVLAEDVVGDIGNSGEAFFVLVDQLAGRIVDGLDLDLSPKDKVELAQVDIRELQALLEYGRSLDAPTREHPEAMWRDKSRDLMRDGSQNGWVVFNNQGIRYDALSFAAAVGDGDTLALLEQQRTRAKRGMSTSFIGGTGAALLAIAGATLLMLDDRQDDEQVPEFVAAGSVGVVGLAVMQIGVLGSARKFAKTNQAGLWWTPEQADEWIRTFNARLDAETP
jgi:TolB-like protein